MLRRLLSERLLPFRLFRRLKSSKVRRDGWLRCVRQAAGLPVDEVARRLGVTRWEVHRLEESERNSRIMLETLSRAAKGLGCELVYALVPVEESLEEMAEAQMEVRESKRKERSQNRLSERQKYLVSIGWEESFLRAMGTFLRRKGIRVRPRKAEQGVDEQLDEAWEKLKLVEGSREAASSC
jgi:transcriptional regulator with XRE-family HTH domain